MADEKQSAELESGSSQSRIMTTLIIVMVAFAGIVVMYQKLKDRSIEQAGSSKLASGPGSIESVPGVGKTTRGYSLLQEKQNIEQAQEAAKAGTSSVPTITRSTYAAGYDPELVFGKGKDSPSGDLKVLQRMANSKACQPEALRRARQAGVAAFELRCKGCNVKDLISAGYTAGDLKAAGYKARELLAAGVTLEQLQTAGFSAKALVAANVPLKDLKAAGFSAGELLAAGLPVKELKVLRYTAKDLMDGGASVSSLKSAGFSANAIAQGGYMPCDMAAMGYTAKTLLQTGVSVSRLLQSGFSADELKSAGASGDALRLAGLSVGQLRRAGFNDKALLLAGFSQADINKLMNNSKLSAVLAASCDAQSAKRARSEGVVAQDMKAAGCTASVLAMVGYTGTELKVAGYLAAGLKKAGYQEKELLESGYTPQAIHAACADPKKLLRAGMSPSELRAGGYTPAMLVASGLSAEELAKAGFTAAQIKQAGVDPSAIGSNVYSASELVQAGYGPGALRAMGIDINDLKNANISPEDLRAAGFTAEELIAAGFDPEVLKQAGYTIGDLTRAGVERKNLEIQATAGDKALCSKDALAQAKRSGKNAKVFIDQGCSASDLLAAGYSIRQLDDAGVSISDLKDAGYSAEDLLKAGVSASQLSKAGYSAKELMSAGVPIKDLIDAGYSVTQLKRAGIASQDLLENGISRDELVAFTKDKGTNQVNEQNTSSQDSDFDLPSPNTAMNEGDQADVMLKRLQDQQEKQLTMQEKRDRLNQLSSSMVTQANALISSWSSVPSMSHSETSPIVGAPTAGYVANVPSDYETSGMDNAIERTASSLIVKAGNVAYAVLKTGINSDEAGPVLAEVVGGPLKGSTLLGTFTLSGESVLVKFSSINIPGHPSSETINAVAISAETAKTVLADDVDRHVFLRYGGMFAGSFLSGMSTAVSNAGATVATEQGVTSRSFPDLNSGEKVLVALGETGKAFSDVLSQQYNTPVTVTVNAGRGVGILFMQDFTLNMGQ